MHFKLPNAHLAIVEREKVVAYLLNPAHPDNGGKAAFLEALGFRRDQWQTLAQALRHLAMTGDVSASLQSGHGTKYILDGPIAAPRGTSAYVRTVWIVGRQQVAPRLVTAYPWKEPDANDQGT